MSITFQIHYNASWGQRLAISGNTQKLGNNQASGAIFMDYVKDGIWTLTLDIKSSFTYRYWLLDDDKNILQEEFGEDRILNLSTETTKELSLIDSWRSDNLDSNSLYTSAYTNAVFKPITHKKSSLKTVKDIGLLQFKIFAPRVQPHEQIAICGNIPALGSWNLEQPLLLENSNFPLWTSADISLDFSFEIQYKYGIYDTLQKRILYLESGENRSIKPYHFPLKNQKSIYTNEQFRYPQGEWKGTGVAVPVFSLRSKKGLGIGEFTDLKLLVDWAAQNSMKMVQILPVNDTNATKTWTDSYPYAAISVFALHPMYLNLEAIPGFKKAVNSTDYKKEQTKLNALPEVDYEAVMSAKINWAKAIFETQKDTFLTEKEFKKFMAENGHWLQAYAAFCYLRDKNKTADFTQWSSFKTFSPTALQKLTSEKAKHFDEIAFWYFVQYHLDKQLSEAGQYARDKGIILKGDIPIGIYRYSVDAWTAPELYNMDGQSGAPPDPFSASGQNWGFPTYNWEEMAKDGYQWWKNRFTQLSRYFDSFRIDHILGFFRIWQIPLEQVEGTLGFFNPALSIHQSEFKERGIWFDYQRFCHPFIHEKLLAQLFNTDAATVANTYFEKNEEGVICFKKEFDTQRKIEAHFKIEKNKKNSSWQKGLFELIGNVLFLEVQGSNQSEFHPRIDFLSTDSFQQFPQEMRQRLEALYNDYFYNRQEDFWRNSAMTKLPAIRKATNMLICGEDLGMVPDCVPGVMEELKILTLEIQRMSKNPTTEFLQEVDIPYLSVASPSTHDMSPIRLWWEEMDFEQRNRFFQKELNGYDEAPKICTPEIAKRILQQHLHWRSMWIVFPLQDILAINGNIRREKPEDERINIPANPKHYWRFRFHLSLEELLVSEDLNKDLSRMVLVSGR